VKQVWKNINYARVIWLHFIKGKLTMTDKQNFEKDINVPSKQIIIDASQCEWRTGIEHCGDYECMLNKCCDYNCDWYKRRKLEQQLKRKEQECEELLKDNKALCERIVKLEEEVERQRTTGREYEQRWLTSMGYYGVK
jgi:hypothetical protein